MAPHLRVKGKSMPYMSNLATSLTLSSPTFLSAHCTPAMLPLCYSSNITSMLLPQGLCSCCSLCLDSFGSLHFSLRSLRNGKPSEGLFLTTLNKPAKFPHLPCLLYPLIYFTFLPLHCHTYDVLLILAPPPPAPPPRFKKLTKSLLKTSFLFLISDFSLLIFNSRIVCLSPPPSLCSPNSFLLPSPASSGKGTPKESPGFPPHKWLKWPSTDFAGELCHSCIYVFIYLFYFLQRRS